MSLYFDNNKLFDAEGHLTDEGLYAIKDGTLDDLGALEAAEHLSFCDYCLLRYTAMIDAAPDCMKQPMRDLIPQVQSLMRLRSFRIMTNRYVSTAAAVMLAFALCDFLSRQRDQRGDMRAGPPIVERNVMQDRHFLAGRNIVLICVQIIKAVLTVLFRHGLNTSYLAGVSGPFFVLGCQPFCKRCSIEITRYNSASLLGQQRKF